MTFSGPLSQEIDLSPLKNLPLPRSLPPWQHHQQSLVESAVTYGMVLMLAITVSAILWEKISGVGAGPSD